jgi:diketogulonate reductase-like aldo/keto reductase
LQISEHALYYLHGPDPGVPLEDSLGELAQLKQEGKIRHLGIANINLDQLKMATSLTTIAALQNRCNPFCKGDFNNGVIDFCKINKISYIPYCPLGGWGDHASLAKSELFTYFTAKYDVSSYTICLAWLLHKANHIIPIPGMDHKQQIAANFNSAKVCIEPEDINKIDQFPDLYSPQHIDS